MSTDHVINPAAIEALREVAPDDGGKFLTELVDIFLADTPPRLRELEQALAAGDANAMARAAHSIKGSAGNFGADRVARFAAAVETAAKTGDFATAGQNSQALAEAYTAAAAVLQGLRTP
ncbi:MAG: Hpt domain-containing protein [Candidatus Didemnitutus sp.]|nr:Hpt domain-containing protein [Candidatus Didemnitutus sp.]